MHKNITNTDPPFALDVIGTRQKIIKYFASTPQSGQTIANKRVFNKSNSPEVWFLLGTQGCHLCDEAQKTLAIFNAVHPIEFITIDIMDLEYDLMNELALYIPILLTPHHSLHGSFSVVDLNKLV